MILLCGSYKYSILIALPAECVRTYLRPKARTNILQHGFQMCGAYPGRASCTSSYQEGEPPDKKVLWLDHAVGLLVVRKWHIFSLELHQDLI